MARMSIDDKFLRDPRIKCLAKRLGVSVFDIRGRLLDVFAITYDREEDVLSVSDIDTASDMDGFAAAMVLESLAEQTSNGFRIRGAHERIKYLKKKRNDGEVGGRKSGESRRNAEIPTKARSTPRTSASREVKHHETKHEARRNPSASVPDSASASVPDGVTASPPDSKIADSANASPLTRATAEFFEYFQQTHNGAKPTWGGRQAKQLDTLVKAHGVPEIIRRLSVLRTAPPKFPQAPWDFATFAMHFDKIASPTRTISRASPVQIALEELETARSEDRERESRADIAAWSGHPQ